jgi:hypothetical protein
MLIKYFILLRKLQELCKKVHQNRASKKARHVHTNFVFLF